MRHLLTSSTLRRTMFLSGCLAGAFVALTIARFGNAQPAEPDFAELEKVALDELKATNTPGAAIGIVRGDRLIYAKGFGTSNVETGAPVTPNMLFRLGSTTKMFTAGALERPTTSFALVFGADGKAEYFHGGGRSLRRIK